MLQNTKYLTGLYPAVVILVAGATSKGRLLFKVGIYYNVIMIVTGTIQNPFVILLQFGTFIDTSILIISFPSVSSTYV